MSKRKILLVAMTLCMVAILAVGGTLAYFSDTDKATNVFTTAKIDIALKEQQRDGKGGLKPFEQKKVLFPIVGSAQGEKDEMGMPVAENYVDKIITIENLDDSTDAYVRLYIAIPSALDNVKDAGQNVLHFNIGNNFHYDNSYTVADHANWGAETLLKKDYAIGDINYNVYYRDYNKVMAKDTETGSAAYVGFYLDKGVDYDNEKGYTINGEKINFDFTNGVKIPVFAVGVQSAGFNTAAAAVDAAFGAGYNPF